MASDNDDDIPLEEALRLGPYALLEGDSPSDISSRPFGGDISWVDCCQVGTLRVSSQTSIELLQDDSVVSQFSTSGRIELVSVSSSMALVGLSNEIVQCFSLLKGDVIFEQDGCRALALQLSPSSQLFFVIQRNSKLTVRDTLNNKQVYSHPQVNCACWLDDTTICLGTATGQIIQVSLLTGNTTGERTLASPAEEGFQCTHLNIRGDTIIAGYCCVTPVSDDDDDSDEDDPAQHEACLFVGNLGSNDWHDLGDVVPFFSVPRNGRHQFYTSFLSDKIFCVGANVGSDVALVVNQDEWVVMDLPEGASGTCPTTEDDEYTFCVGVAAQSYRVYIAATDGSTSVLDLMNQNDPNYLPKPSYLAIQSPPTSLPENLMIAGDPPSRMRSSQARTSKPAAPKTVEPESSDKPSNPFANVTLAAPANNPFAPVKSPSSFAFGNQGSSAFSFGGGSLTAKSAFSFEAKKKDEPSNSFSFGAPKPAPAKQEAAKSNPISFGAPKLAETNVTPAKQEETKISAFSFGNAAAAKPAFGSSPTKPSFGSSGPSAGGFAFGVTSPLGGRQDTTPQKAEPKASIFGSGTAPPTFGSGTAAPTFGSGFQRSDFGALATTQKDATGFGSPNAFSAFEKKKSSPKGMIAKPLFGENREPKPRGGAYPPMSSSAPKNPLTKSSDRKLDKPNAEYKERMVKIYTKYNPEKVKQLDAMLLPYIGSEHELL